MNTPQKAALGSAGGLLALSYLMEHPGYAVLLGFAAVAGCAVYWRWFK